jgi:hypothetical protein
VEKGLVWFIWERKTKERKWLYMRKMMMINKWDWKIKMKRESFTFWMKEERVKLVGGGSHQKVRVKVTCECELL